MASRQLTLATPRTRPDGSADVDLVRLSINEDHINGRITGYWYCGRLDGGTWEASSEQGEFGYVGSDWTDYLDEGAGSAGQHEAQQDWLLQKLIDDGVVGAGAKGDY